MPAELSGIVGQPPALTAERFDQLGAEAEAAIARVEELWPAALISRALARREHAQLVLAEAWLGHLDEVYVTIKHPPFRGDVDAYIASILIGAAAEMRRFLSAAPIAWRPKIGHFEFGGVRLHRAVDYLVKCRIEANGGGCEQCHVAGHLELHHLHYGTFSREIASDVMKLCRECHYARHRTRGFPQDAGWRDSIRWTA